MIQIDCPIKLNTKYLGMKSPNDLSQCSQKLNHILLCNKFQKKKKIIKERLNHQFRSTLEADIQKYQFRYINHHTHIKTNTWCSKHNKLQFLSLKTLTFIQLRCHA
ncbi:hypothetical protein AAHE18_18G147900 [Arachis hypogaea]